MSATELIDLIVAVGTARATLRDAERADMLSRGRGIDEAMRAEDDARTARLAVARAETDLANFCIKGPPLPCSVACVAAVHELAASAVGLRLLLAIREEVPDETMVNAIRGVYSGIFDQAIECLAGWADTQVTSPPQQQSGWFVGSSRSRRRVS